MLLYYNFSNMSFVCKLINTFLKITHRATNNDIKKHNRIIVVLFIDRCHFTKLQKCLRTSDRINNIEPNKKLVYLKLKTKIN